MIIEVPPPQVIGEHIASFLSKYGQILGATCDNLTKPWNFQIMFFRKPFISITQMSERGGPEIAVYCDQS